MPWLKRWLERSKTRPEERPEAGWVRIVTAPNRIVAGMLEGALEEQGIPFYERYTGLQSIYTSATNQRQILVPAAEEEQAREIVDGIWREGEGVDGGGEDD